MNAGSLVTAFVCLLLSRLNDPLLAQFPSQQKPSGDPVVKRIESSREKGRCLAAVVDDVPLVHTGQILPIDQRGILFGGEHFDQQAKKVFDNLSAVLEAAHASNIVKLNVYLAQANLMPLMQQAMAGRFDSLGPVVSFVISALPEARALLAIDAVAACSGKSSPTVEEFSPPSTDPQKSFARARVLPAGGKVYVSGMADTNSLPEATRKTLEKLIGVLGHLGLSKTDIIQLKAFLQPMSQVETVRKELRSFFEENVPPSVFVEWISPSPNPPIEIELIASARGDFSKEPDSVTFLTPPGTTSTKVFSRVARVNHGKQIYFSGLYGEKSQDVAAQVREIFGKIGEVLPQVGSDFQHLVKATYYVSDEPASKALNDLRPEYFNPERPPAASKAKVTNVGLPGKTVTLDMIAVTKLR